MAVPARCACSCSEQLRRRDNALAGSDADLAETEAHVATAATMICLGSSRGRYCRARKDSNLEVPLFRQKPDFGIAALSQGRYCRARSAIREELPAQGQDGGHPPLIEIGLVHAQFETIHPFLDGNGRVGRLLITFLLVLRKVLRSPLLYLSFYLKLHRLEYYDRLTAVRVSGDWEGWLRFFLRGVAATAAEATQTAERIYALRERHRSVALEEAGANGLRLLSELFRRPLVNVNYVPARIEVTFATANRLVARFEELGILKEVTGQRRSRLFRYEPYLELFDEPESIDEPSVEPEVTESP